MGFNSGFKGLKQTCAARFNVQKFYVLQTQQVYVFLIDLRTNSDYHLIKPTLHAQEYRRDRCSASLSACFGTPWVPFLDSPNSKWSSAFEMIRSMQQHQYVYKSVEATNKMQPCNRIYYSKFYWRLNMFRAAYRSSSGAPNYICSLWLIYPCGDRSLSSLDNYRSPHGYINQRLQIEFGAPDDERYAARNMLSLH